MYNDSLLIYDSRQLYDNKKTNRKVGKQVGDKSR